MKLTIIILSQLLLISITHSATQYYSINDGGGLGGEWNISGSWSGSSGGPTCNCTPGTSPVNSSEAFIQTHMNLDVSVTEFGILRIATGKSLQTSTNNLEIKSGSTFILYGTLKVWDLTFFNGSTIDVKPGGVIIVLHNFTNNNNSDAVTIDGTITVEGTFYNGNGGVLQGAGSITAGTFTGNGETFGHSPNSDIPPNSTVDNGPLPIELISFTANSENRKVVLKWITSKEINNEYFSIERSVNSLDFEVIEKVKGKGNSNILTSYIYYDNNPLHGISYYRLRQTDYDGKNSVSEIVSIDISKLKSIPLSFEIYPNPISGNENTNIKISEFESETEILVVVRNLLGEELYSKVVITDFTGNYVTAIDPEKRLSAGTYLIIGTSLNQTFNKHLIIN